MQIIGSSNNRAVTVIFTAVTFLKNVYFWPVQKVVLLNSLTVFSVSKNVLFVCIAKPDKYFCLSRDTCPVYVQDGKVEND